jgi:hypothetical protein
MSIAAVVVGWIVLSVPVGILVGRWLKVAQKAGMGPEQGEHATNHNPKGETNGREHQVR